LHAQDCDNGIADGIYPCNNVHLRSHINLTALGASSSNDIWGWTSPTTGREYALTGIAEGTVFVDVTDPNDAWVIGRLATPSSASSWRDIKVVGNYAYIGSEAGNSGLQVFDLTQLDQISSPPANPMIFEEENNSNADVISTSHNIVSNPETGLLATVGTRAVCNGGIVFYDTAANPSDPPQRGCFADDGYTHDAVCFIYRGPDTRYLGQEICIALNEDTYTIIDATNRNTPTLISRTTYADSRYTHQGWVTDDHKYLIVNDEIDETALGINTRTLIFDISNLENPVDHTVFNSTESAIDHNLYVRGSLVYQSNYRAGLRILDIEDIDNKNITEVAYFDIFPSDNDASYNGAWSVYPYFDNQKIIINAIEGGLFVVEHDMSYFFIRKVDNGIAYFNDEAGIIRFDIEIVSVGNFNNQVDIDLQGLPPGVTVQRNDQTNGNVTTASFTLTIPTNTPLEAYSITAVGTSPNMPTQRLGLGILPNRPLSADWLYFHAEAHTNITNKIQWAVANEQEDRRYQIQRSTTGKGDWTDLGSLEAGVATVNETGAYLYEWIDQQPLRSSFYRITSIEADGKQRVSSTTLVERTAPTTFTVYPNPTNDRLQIRYTSEAAQTVWLELIDPLGAVVLRQQQASSIGLNYSTIDISTLSKGIYFIRQDGMLMERIVKR
ncbi:MAG: choice-of-anchor B family protein, partial [Bacteroidota bacterium]